MLKGERREAAWHKRRYSMRVSGRSIKAVLAYQKGAMGLAAKRRKEKK